VQTTGVAPRSMASPQVENDARPVADDAGFYRALGVDPAASTDEMRRAYVKLARELHPDKNGSAAAVMRLQGVGEAWSVLKNSRLRAVYDRRGKDGLDELEDRADESDEDDSDDEQSESSEEGAIEPSPMGSSQATAPPNEALRAFFGLARGAPLHSSDASARNPAGEHACATSGEGADPLSSPAPALDHELALQIAHAVAQAIERTEASAARRYERSLTSLLMSLDPSVHEEQAAARAKHAWADAEHEHEDVGEVDR
jgi:DnaJ-class molecular chaperone